MKTIGDRARFALDFDLASDPDSDSSPRYRGSWGRFRIWVGGANLMSAVTAHGEGVDAAECPLLPVVEWFVDNWDPLFHEERLPRPDGCASSAEWHTRVLAAAPDDEARFDQLLEDRLAWWSRHGLGAALPDFRIPDVHFRRRDEQVEVSWTDAEWRTVPSGVQLAIQPGVASVPLALVCDAVAEWCTEVTKAVKEEVDVGDLPAKLAALGEPGRAQRRLELASGQERLEAAARRIRSLAGLSPGDLGTTIGQLLGISTKDSGGLFATLTVPVLLYRSARPGLTEPDLRLLLQLFGDLKEGSNAPFEAVRAPDPCPVTPEQATLTGYDLARTLRNELSLPAAQPLTNSYDLEGFVITTLGIEVRDVTLSDFGVEGVAIWAAGRLPLIAVNLTGRFASTPWGRRMTIAHELCHLLYDGSESGVGVVSNGWAPYTQERRANAFAAMLLAPSAALEQVLDQNSSSRWTDKDLVRAMRFLGVGATTLCRQLQNLQWITREESEAWMEVLASGDR